MHLEEVRRAKAELIENNLRLVISCARHFQDRGLHFIDLIQEGNVGLIKAVDKYDPNRG
jgi:RNA polymerase primary sigma factor